MQIQCRLCPQGDYRLYKEELLGGQTAVQRNKGEMEHRRDTKQGMVVLAVLGPAAVTEMA